MCTYVVYASAQHKANEAPTLHTSVAGYDMLANIRNKLTAQVVTNTRDRASMVNDA